MVSLNNRVGTELYLLDICHLCPSLWLDDRPDWWSENHISWWFLVLYWLDITLYRKVALAAISLLWVSYGSGGEYDPLRSDTGYSS